MRRVKAKIVSGGQDDASMQLDWLWAEIKSRFGVCPSFFKSAQPEPLIARQLFQIAELGYLDSPIPELFKEKLFTWLSRFCNVRYCVARHCAFLLGRGVTAEQALALLNEPMPGKAELSACLRALEEVPAPLGDWPDFDSDLGRCIRVACAVVMLQPVRAAVWLRALHQLLGPQRYEQLMLFVAFVRTAHFWTQIHPELKFEPDLEAMLHEHESFAEPLLRGGDEATRWQPGHPFRDEMKSQRETQKSMEAIRDNAARFGAIFENAAVGIARVSTDGRFLEVNQRFCEIVGYAREDLMTKTFGDITYKDDLDADLREMQRMLLGEIEIYRREKRYCRKDGSVVWGHLTVSLTRKTDGSPNYFISIVEDISAGKRAEEGLRASDEQFRVLADTAPVMIWTSGTDRLCTFFNQPWLAFTGRTMEEELGKGWTEGVHPDDRAHCLETYASSFDAQKPFEMEYRLRRYDGEYRWVLDHGVPRLSLGGDLLGYIGSCIDITERKEVEEALRESKEQLAGIVSSAMDAIITVDEQERVILFNEAAEYMFGCGAGDAIGQSLDRFIPARFRQKHSGHIRRFGETGTSRGMGRLGEITALRADGTEFPIEASISKTEVGGRKLYTVVHRDITDRKQAEADLVQLSREQAAREAAEAANRAKDEFLAMVSHELRSPLNAILGYTSILRSESTVSENIKKATAVIERNAKAQLQIIEDLLDSARIIAGKLRIEPVLVDLTPVLESALDMVRSAAEAKGVTLITDFDAEPEQVFGDPARLQQVISNLLLNAVKFTSAGGKVELQMRSDADHIGIVVRDSGKGIEPGFLPFVFDRFRQADPLSVRRVGGLGLGLSLVKHLVELHGGTITAASDGIGHGATFTVTLPRRAEFAPPPLAVAARDVGEEGTFMLDHAVSLEGVSALVVDDQEEARVILTQSLSQYGAQVTAVPSGSEALAFLASKPPGSRRPDVLILDIAMPEEDGYTVLKKVRALESERGDSAHPIPAIALTAFARSEDRLRALQAGFHMHVAKPVEPAELIVVIASLTNRRPAS